MLPPPPFRHTCLVMQRYRRCGEALTFSIGGTLTGKTLTAESVAESPRSLFITSGDIGAEAEHVEKYLQSVLAPSNTSSQDFLLSSGPCYKAITSSNNTTPCTVRSLKSDFDTCFKHLAMLDD